MVELRQQEQIQTALWGLVLAAGDGKRLQPYIRETRGTDLPKQFVNFVGRHSMLEHTYRRSQLLIPARRVLTIVSKQHLRHPEVRRQLQNRRADTVIVQPANKETGPGILLPLLHLYKRNPEAIVTVFPSDHFILDADRFMDHVELAARAVAREPSRIVLLAMEAQAPEVEYGYILPQGSEGLFNLWGTRQVAHFVEKPDCRLAQELVKAGGLWNTMIMVFKVRTVLEMMKRLCPATYYHFTGILDALGTPREAQAVEALYEKIEPMNFSKDFLEKVSDRMPATIAVLPVLEVYWSDWGSPDRLVQTLELLERARCMKSVSEPTVPRKPYPEPANPARQIELP
ncbi:MAG: sugar phosphate nucleotidyltransferase [Candidatus Binatia bacterium]